MINQKFVAGLCCALLLALSGCSRQQSDWQKTRETNTADAYEQFLKKYPSGEFTAQAQARVKELYEERDWQKARDADTPEAYQSFLKQYPEGKWTEEARIRVENFTLAQAPGASGAASPGMSAATPGPDASGVPVPADAENGAVSAASPKPVGTPPKPATGSSGAASAPVAAKSAVPAPAAPTPAAPKSASAKSSGKGGWYGIQLGAFKSGAAAAHQRWAHLQKQYPSLLSGLSSKVKKTADGHLYRLQAVGLTEKRAREICTALKAKSQACVVVPAART